MTIRNRLQLTGLVPIVLLFLLSSYFVVTSYLNFIKASSLKLSIKNTILLDDTLVNIGKERGLSTLYLGSEKKSFKNALQKQKIQVDHTIARLKSNLITENKYQLPFLPKHFKTEPFFDKSPYEALVHTLDTLPTIRPLVEQPNINFKTLMFTQYTTQLTTPLLNNIFMMQQFSLNAEISSLIVALRQIAMVQEYSGLERGFVSYFLLKKQAMPVEDTILWHQLKTKANIFDMAQITSTPLREKLETMLHNPTTVKQSKTLAILSETIAQHTHDGAYPAESMQWFSQQSHKISRFSKMQLLISNTLWHKSTLYLEKHLLILAIALLLWLLSFILAYLHYKTTREVSQRKKRSKKAQNTQTDIITPTTSASLLAQASHDIRTPLHGIVGFIKVLRNTPLDKEQNEILSIMDKSTSNLLQSINSHLNTERFNTKKETLTQRSFATQKLFENALETFMVIAADKGIALHFYMDPDIPASLQSDPVKITTVLNNLISNAIQYTKKGGEVNLEITQTSHKEKIHTLHFLVQDTGIGITKKAQETIFEPFTQLDTETKTQENNSGLGLYISHQLVSLLGGTLAVQSEENKGSSFFFTLALENSEEIQKTQTPFSTNALALCKHPSSTLNRYMQKYFEYYGTKVSYFETLATLETLKKEHPTQHYLIDSDHCTQDILEAIQTLDPATLTLIATIQDKEKIKALGIDTNQIIYKPLTHTKIQKILHPTQKKLAPQKSHILPSFTQFNADVLITEDNTINLKLMQRMLHMHGIRTETAMDGLEALKKRKQNNYDLIFMDIHMPGIDGVESTHLIREYEKNKDVATIPIVALTANTIEANKENFIDDGFNEYIAKPIDTTELLRILHLFLKEEKNTTAVKEVIQESTTAKEKITTENNIKETAIQTPIETTNTLASSTAQEEVTKLKTETKEKTTAAITQTLPPETVVTETTPEPSVKNTQTLPLTTEIQEKKILIAKRFLLEEKILIKVMKSLTYPYEILTKEESLKEALESYRYDIVFTDSHFIDEEIEAYADIIHIVTNQKSKEEIKKLILEYRA